MWLIGVLAAGFYACGLAKKNKLDDNDTILLLLVSSIGVVSGGALLYGITNYSTAIYIFSNLQLITDFNTFIQAVMAIFGGSVFYGGLLGGLFAAWLYLKATKRDIELYMWMLAPIIPFFHFFGRIGCFLSGCCYGIESSIGFVYNHSPIPQANGVVRFPVQLVEAAFNLLLFFLLTYLQKNSKFKKYLIHIYLLCYAVFRFIIEFFRGDDYRGVFLGISTSQLISIGLVLASSLLIYKKYRKAEVPA